MEKEWVMVRLERSVHGDLMQLRDSLETARQRGQVDLPEHEDGVSLSQMVARLIRHLCNDRRRMREARARARQRRADGLLGMCFELTRR